MGPVWRQRVLGATEHKARIGGVLLRGIKIREACSRDGHVKRDQRRSPQGGVVPQLCVSRIEERTDPRACSSPYVGPEGHECVEVRLIEDSRLRRLEQMGSLDYRQIEDRLSDRDTGAGL